MAGKRRTEAEILAECEAKAAAIKAKIARKQKLETDEFAASCDRAIKALRRVADSADPMVNARLIQRIEIVLGELDAVLQPDVPIEEVHDPDFEAKA